MPMPMWKQFEIFLSQVYRDAIRDGKRKATYVIDDYADYRGFFNHEASRYQQAYIRAMRNPANADDIIYIIKRTDDTRTGNSVWRIIHKMKDSNEIGKADVNDMCRRMEIATTPELVQLAMIQHPKSRKRALQKAEYSGKLLGRAMEVVILAAQGIGEIIDEEEE